MILRCLKEPGFWRATQLLFVNFGPETVTLRRLPPSLLRRRQLTCRTTENRPASLRPGSYTPQELMLAYQAAARAIPPWPPSPAAISLHWRHPAPHTTDRQLPLRHPDRPRRLCSNLPPTPSPAPQRHSTPAPHARSSKIHWQNSGDLTASTTPDPRRFATQNSSPQVRAPSPRTTLWHRTGALAHVVFRWHNRVAAYAFVLVTDRYPPFRLAPRPGSAGSRARLRPIRRHRAPMWHICGTTMVPRPIPAPSPPRYPGCDQRISVERAEGIEPS